MAIGKARARCRASSPNSWPAGGRKSKATWRRRWPSLPAAGMVGGQVEDWAAEGRGEKAGTAVAGSDDLERIHRLKTGALFRSCLMMGYHVAPANRRDAIDRPLERLDTYGACFGLAFQIT